MDSSAGCDYYCICPCPNLRELPEGEVYARVRPVEAAFMMYSTRSLRFPLEGAPDWHAPRLSGCHFFDEKIHPANRARESSTTFSGLLSCTMKFGLLFFAPLLVTANQFLDDRGRAHVLRDEPRVLCSATTAVSLVHLGEALLSYCSLPTDPKKLIALVIFCK